GHGSPARTEELGEGAAAGDIEAPVRPARSRPRAPAWERNRPGLSRTCPPRPARRAPAQALTPAALAAAAFGPTRQPSKAGSGLPTLPPIPSWPSGQGREALA